MNKKGFIYVISAGLLVAVLLIVFFSAQEFTFSDATSSNIKRIGFANDFVESFNQDLERALNIASFRSMIALEEHIALTGNFLDDTESLFIEVVETGSINGTEYEIMTNSSLNEYLKRINVIANRFGLRTNVSISNISLSQSDAWHLLVSINASVFVADVSGYAFWNYTNYYESKVPIENLRDPLYTVYTKNRVSNTIRPYNKSIEGLLVDGNNVSNLLEFIDGSFYIESDSAPNFLERFSNLPPSSSYGIESIVNVLEISDQGIDTFPSRIKIDYIYFNNIPILIQKFCDFSGVPNNLYFVLHNDTSTLQRYQVQNLTYVPCT